jgi:hypothetical protein
MTLTAEVAQALGALTAAVDELAALDTARLPEDCLLEVLRCAEKQKRRLEALDAPLIAEVETRNLAGKYVVRGTSALLSGLLKLSPRESRSRVERARELAPRVALTGEQLPAVLPVVAEARSAGAVTAQHVDVIASALRRLHTRVPGETVAAAERFLVDKAADFDAQNLAGVARQLVDTLDPDGSLAESAEQQRRRHLSCSPLGNGMYRISGELDAETSALAMTVLHSLAAPTKPEAAERDERRPGQRMHDAFRCLLKLALRAGQLPASGGIPATVLISMTAEEFESGTGLASTAFGQRLAVSDALRLADEASVAWVVHNSRGGILNYGTRNRLASERQTLALIARDKGCSFPGCTDPPQWTERHHIVSWRAGGTTDLDNLCLLCDHHHDRIDSGGWRIEMREGVPWFIPPSWLDPEQKPQRNVRP